MSGGARALLERAVAAHGGREAWGAASWVTARVWCGGPAYLGRGRLRGVEGTEVRVATHGQRVLLRDWPHPGHWGEWTGPEAWVSDHAGRIVARRPAPGPGLRAAAARPWDRLHLLHAVGPALWTAMSLPFALERPGVQVEDLGPTHEAGWPRDRIRAALPPGTWALARHLVIHLDELGRMRRLDHPAAAPDGRGRMADNLLELRAEGGLIWPARRETVPRRRDGTVHRGPVLAWLRADGVRLDP